DHATRDNTTLELSTDGGSSWTSLARYEGQGNGPARIDLSRWDGQTVQLRFNIDKTYYGGSGSQFSNLQLASDGQSVVPLANALRQPATRALVAADDAQLKLMEALAADKKDVIAALPFYQALLDEAHEPDIDARRNAVEQLADPGLWTALRPHFGSADFATRAKNLSDLSKAIGVTSALALADLPPELLPLAQQATLYTLSGLWKAEENGLTVRFNPGLQEHSTVTTGVIPLAGRKHTRLAFDVSHDFGDSTGDGAVLEGSEDGKTWTRLAQYQKSADQAPQSIDLHSWDGRSIQLRWRVDRSFSEGTCMAIRHLRLTSDGQADTPLDEAVRQPMVDVLRQSTATDAPALQALARTLGGLSAAAALWPVVKDSTPEARDAIGALAAEIGVKRASDVWPALDGLPEASWKAGLAVARNVAAHDAMPLWPLLAASRRDADFPRIADVFAHLLDRMPPDQLSRCWPTGGEVLPQAEMLEVKDRCGSEPPGLDPVTRQSLLQALREVPMATPEGTWQADGRGWKAVGSIFLQDYSSLTTFPFKAPPRLTFNAQQTLNASDNLSIALSTNGQDWTSLPPVVGKADGPQALDLSAWAGRPVQLRFSVNRSHAEGPELHIGALQLSSGEPLDVAICQAAIAPVLALLDAPAPAADRQAAMQVLLALPPSDRETVLNYAQAHFSSVATALAPLSTAVLLGAPTADSVLHQLENSNRGGIEEEDGQVSIGDLKVSV
ncbi:MAG: hypothetical protein ACYCW6_22295, partial [Candidatus Xenobia bacterium]